MLGICSFISHQNLLNENKEEFLGTWGSLFDEFKNDKGLLSTQYYSIFFARRLAFAISQVYLNSELVVQGLLNLFFSFVQLGYLIIFRPFKERRILYYALSTEICVFLVNTCTFAMLYAGDNTKVLSILELITILVVYTNVISNICLSLLQYAKFARKIFSMIKKKIMMRKVQPECVSPDTCQTVKNFINTHKRIKAQEGFSAIISDLD